VFPKLQAETFQQTWLKGAKLLIDNNWEVQNLVVHIQNPAAYDEKIHKRIADFANANHLIGPKHVAYTIFPHKLYETYTTSASLFHAYNRQGGLYERLRRRPRSGWGTYFRRMTHYENNKCTINQLKNIIDAIDNRRKIYKAAYTIVIQKPGGETIRPLGGPCLNYIAVQLKSEVRELGLLCVYRNHDYLERAYGNYWGLCNLCRVSLLMKLVQVLAH
ncbi:unnamed protein product, partial [marine sediment metagenome]